jgi:predicted dehydrogenase
MAQELYPGVPIYADVSEMLTDNVSCDAAVVASSELTHFAIAMALIDAGLNCLVEKPLAESAADAQHLLEASAARGTILQAGFILRYEPRHLLLHQAIREGKLGDLQLLRAKRDVSRSWFHAYGHTVNPILETTVHDIDLALWLFGSRPVSVQAWGTYGLGYEIPESVTMLIRFESGGQAFLTSSWLRTDRDVPNILSWALDDSGADAGGVIAGDLEVLGDKGTARIASYSDSFCLSTDAVTAYPDTSFWPVIGGRVWGALAAEGVDFVQRVAGGASLGVASIEDAVLGQRVAEAGIRSLQTGDPESV